MKYRDEVERRILARNRYELHEWIVREEGGGKT